MVMEVPLIWKLQVEGADRIKSVMNDLNSAFQRGQISSTEYADSMSKIGRESNRVNNISRTQNQIFLAMHPNINKLSRAFSTFSSISRTALSIMTAFNTMLIAQNTSEYSKALYDVGEAERELIRAIASGDEEAIQRAKEKVAITKAYSKELENTAKSDWWQSVVIAFSVVSGIITESLMVLRMYGFQFSNIFAGIAPRLGGFLSWLTRVLPMLGALANPFVAIGVAMSLIGGYIADFLVGLLGLTEWRENNGKILTEFFTVAIPTALGQAGAFLSNFFLNDLPTWAKSGWETVSTVFVTTWNNLMGFIETGINMALQGFAVFVNAIIGGINSIISGINRAFKSNIPAIQPFVIQNISLPKIKTEVAQPVGSPAKGQIGPSNTYITVQGSVITERQLMNMVDDKFKGWLKDRGFTGFQ